MNDAWKVGDQFDEPHDLADLASVEPIDVVNENHDPLGIVQQRIGYGLTPRRRGLLVERRDLTWCPEELPGRTKGDRRRRRNRGAVVGQPPG
jgi:hypothetical protein